MIRDGVLKRSFQRHHQRVVIAAWILASLLAAYASGVQAQTVNGCGSGWNVWVVPDSLPLAGCTFHDSCNKHDVCYGKCEGSTTVACSYLRCKSGGDLHGSAQCLTDLDLLKSSTDAFVRKQSCDRTLKIDIVAANPGKSICAALGRVYELAVKHWGDGAFSGLATNVPPEAWRQSEEDYNRAIRDFFRLGTAAQFKAFLLAVDGARPSLVMTKPIAFDPARGLVNIKLADENTK